MKDLKRVVDTYLATRESNDLPRAVYIGGNAEVRSLLGETCELVDTELEPAYSVGTHASECELLVLDGEPEPFKEFLPSAKIVIYIGPNTSVRQPFRNIMNYEASHLDIHTTPEGVWSYSSRAVAEALSLAFAATTRPPEGVWTTRPPEEEITDPLDDPTKPVNTTPPPRDFFSMGQ